MATMSELRANLHRRLTDAGLVDVQITDEYPGFVAHFDLLNTAQSDSERKKIVMKAMDLMYGMDYDKANKNAYYFNFGNTEKSYGILGFIFSEFPGSREGAYQKKFAYLQNRGRVNMQIVAPLEPDMKNDKRYTNPIDVDYA